MRMRSAVALRGRRQGAAAPPAPPARGVAPGNPNLRPSRGACLVHMLMGRSELAAAHTCFGIPEACADGLIMRQSSLAGGLGACYAPNGEREGQSRLAKNESS